MAESPRWTPAGWGGGGFYYAAAFHPTRDGVIYLAGDVGGVYKTEDHGKHWRLINRGIAGYSVFSLAVDPGTPDTVYAATDEGLCRSSDAGESWTALPNTDEHHLRITGEKTRSVRCIAVDPFNSNIVYAGSPGGKIYKSQDRGQTWAIVYEKKFAPQSVPSVRVQFGDVNGAILWRVLDAGDVSVIDHAAGRDGIRFFLEGRGTGSAGCVPLPENRRRRAVPQQKPARYFHRCRLAECGPERQ